MEIWEVLFEKGARKGYEVLNDLLNELNIKYYELNEKPVNFKFFWGFSY